MRKKTVFLFMVSALLLLNFNSVFAVSVEELKAVPTLAQMKDLIQDINQMQTVKIGKSSQSADPSAKDDIEWIVLDRDDTQATLVSKKVLDKSEFSEENSEIRLGEIIRKSLDNFQADAFEADEFKQCRLKFSYLLTKSDIDNYFTQADGNKKLAVAENAKIPGQLLDYWLANEELARTGLYFSAYGNYHTGYFGEKFGLRPVIIVEFSSNQ